MKDIPILFLIYNRPAITAESFSAIRKLKPKFLYIAADGPGDRASEIRCADTRKIVEKIDWECKVKKLYREKHLGLKKAVFEAITWFFENVEEGIILEDDCLINESFINFCGGMLSKYRKDAKVMHIGGSNFLPVNMQDKDGYYFSKYDNVWGWATWRRSWKKMDIAMKNWRNFVNSGKITKVLPNFWEAKYWQVLADAVIKNKIDSWAYRWQFTIWENGGIAISPGVNLVENIGLALKGTHINTNVKRLGVKAKPINQKAKLLDNSYSEAADKFVRDRVYRISPLMVFAQWLYYQLKTK